jgi:ABC-2 type transport system permease protein
MKRQRLTFGWIWFLLALAAVNIFAFLYHFRVDLTEERRYSLSSPTKELLRTLDEPVDITIFLEGDMPAGFKKLASGAGDLLEEFRELARGNIEYRFQKPGDGMDESLKNAFLDSLHTLGLNPMNVKAQTGEGEGQEQRFIYPGALVSYKGNVMAVDFLQGQSSVNGINSLNNAEALLEYKLASAIRKLSRDTLPLVGYLSGNGQPLSYNVYDLINSLKESYNFRILPIDQVATIPPIFSALLVVKPSIGFTDEQKLKLDQYIMQGGKVMWMIDNLYAEFDSLQRTQNDFIAFDRALRLDDQLFKYGVRINTDLVQSLDCDQIPSVIGNAGGKPQIELLPWPYFPLLGSTGGHPVSKNLDYVVSQFPHSIDTVQAAGIKKTILLSTSDQSRILPSPAKVSWNSVQNEEDLRTFTARQVPVAVLLEGRFSSFFTNRLTVAMKDTLARAGQQFLSQSAVDNSMIVVSDGDLALNAVTQKEGPLPMGKNMFTGYQYANKDFIFNCIEFLTDRSGILEARSKDYTLRLFDKSLLAENRATWQVVNIVVPIAVIVLLGSIFQWVRKRKHGS